MYRKLLIFPESKFQATREKKKIYDQCLKNSCHLICSMNIYLDVDPQVQKTSTNIRKFKSL